MEGKRLAGRGVRKLAVWGKGGEGKGNIWEYAIVPQLTKCPSQS